MFYSKELVLFLAPVKPKDRVGVVSHQLVAFDLYQQLNGSSALGLITILTA